MKFIAIAVKIISKSNYFFFSVNRMKYFVARFMAFKKNHPIYQQKYLTCGEKEKNCHFYAMCTESTEYEFANDGRCECNKLWCSSVCRQIWLQSWWIFFPSSLAVYIDPASDTWTFLHLVACLFLMSNDRVLFVVTSIYISMLKMSAKRATNQPKSIRFNLFNQRTCRRHRSIQKLFGYAVIFDIII